MGLKIDVLSDSHPNEEIGPLLYRELQEASYAGVRARIAHQQAARAGRVRFLGTSEIMGHYPGSLLSNDPEDVAAALNMDWLGSHVGDEQTLVYDVHSNAFGIKFQEVGIRALRAGMVGAYILGYETCIVRPDAFYGAVPNAVALEATMPSDLTQQVATVTSLSNGLGNLAAMDMAELEDQYHDVLPHLVFLSRRSVYATGPAKSHPELIASLEAIPYEPGITGLELDQTTRQALELPSNVQLYIAGGQYNNLSSELPKREPYSDRLRRLVLCDIFYKVEPPVVDGNWANFKQN